MGDRGEGSEFPLILAFSPSGRRDEKVKYQQDLVCIS
jgi:hypothetical protein